MTLTGRGPARAAARRAVPAAAPAAAGSLSPGDGWLLPGGLVLAAAAAGLTMAALGTAEPGPAIIWASVALAAWCGALLTVTAALAGQPGLGLTGWKTGPWSLAWGAVSFGLATISWTAPQTGPAAEILPGSILAALGLIAVAMTMLTVGYLAGPHRLATRQARRVSSALEGRRTGRIRTAAVPWLLLAAGAGAQAAEAALTGQFGYVGDVAAAVSTASGYQQVLAVIGQCVPLAVVAAAVRSYAARTAAARLSLAAVFAIAIGLGAVAGGKQSFIVAILAVLIPAAAARTRVPWAALAAAVLFFLVVVIPFNQAYRAAVRGQVTLGAGRAIAAAPGLAGQVIRADLSPAVLAQSAGYLAQRVRSIDSPAIIMQRTPAQIPYRSPAELAAAPLADVVPRFLWPGKPILAAGYQFSQQYFDLPPSLYTASAITPEGDLYRHGGWVPLVAGMFVLGCGLRVLDDSVDVRASQHAAFLIVLLFPEIVQSGDDWSGMLAGLPETILLWLAVVWVCFGRRGREPRDAAG